MHKQPHPDLEQLDRLRAGLLDDAAKEKTALQQHLAECPTCRAQVEGWTQFGAGMLDKKLGMDTLQRDLQHARRRALSGGSGSHARAFVPYATAAMLLLAVSIGIWTIQPGDDSQPLQTAQSTEAVPDTYEDIDFYLWLANQEDNGTDENPGNPNST